MTPPAPTDRQEEVWKLWQQGLTKEQIAAQLGISPGSVQQPYRALRRQAPPFMTHPPLLRITQAALTTCTPTQRTVLAAIYLGPAIRTNRQVADALGITERSVERHKAEAITRIRTHLEETEQ